MALQDFKAFLTKYTFLMNSATGKYQDMKKLIDIISYPDMGSDPEKVEVTTLSHGIKAYIDGLQDVKSFSFEGYYTPELYTKLQSIEKATKTKHQMFALYIGGTDGDTPTGDLGCIYWTGELTVYLKGAGSNEGHKLAISITVDDKPEFSATKKTD